MKLRHRVNLFILSAVLVLFTGIMLFGWLAITQAIHTQYEWLMRQRLDNLKMQAEMVVGILGRWQIDDPDFVQRKQREVLERYQEFRFEETGRLIIVDRKMRPVFPLASRTRRFFDRKIWEPIRNNDSGLVRFSSGGNEYFGYHSQFEPWGWHYLVCLDTDEMNRNRSGYFFSVSLVATLLTLFLLVYTNLSVRGLVRRIQSMVTIVREVESGNLTIPRAVDYPSDELGVLQRGLVDMVTQIEARTNEARENREAMQESEANYRGLIESSYDGIYLLYNGRFEIVNQRFREILGIPDGLDPALTYYRDLLSPDYKPSIGEQLMKLGEIDSSPGTQIFSGQTFDDREIEIEVSISYIHYKDGTACQGILRDISERRRMEKQLQQSQKMEALGTLAGGIAHDFNNILSGILGYIDLMKLESSLSATGSEILAEIEKAGDRAKALVGQILTINRKSEQNKTPVPVAEILRDTMKMLRSSLPSTINIEQTITAEGFVLGDGTQIHQIVLNLATNAWHALPEDGGTIWVELSRVSGAHLPETLEAHHDSECYLRLSVSDNGSGIPEELQERIFEPYFTTKSKNRGTGLGLAIIHGIVANYRGLIELNSKPGLGTEFAIYLPEIHNEAETPAVITPTPSRGFIGASVLFVDDEQTLVNINTTGLKHLGYKVIGLSNPTKALELFNNHPGVFDILITDMTMPGMTGLKLAIEAMKIRPELPVVVCTGYSESITQESAESAGIRRLLHKPLTPTQLSEIIQTVL